MRITFYGNFGVSYSSESHHAKSLEALGHTVVRLQEPVTPAEVIQTEAASSDIFVWIKTHGWDTPGIDWVLDDLRQRRIPIISYHLDAYMPIPERWARYRNDPYMMGLDHFFTCDRLMADWLNANTPVRGHYLPAGVFGDECYMSTESSPWANDVLFVGQRSYHEIWPYRPQLVDWLHSTYGERFSRIAGDAPSGTVRGAALNALYANSKVVVGDSLCLGFDYPDYWSDRVYETMGRGGFLIMPYIKGLDRYFDSGVHLAFYDFGNFEQLKGEIDYFLENEDARERIRRAGQAEVAAKHTYVHRWQTILGTL